MSYKPLISERSSHIFQVFEQFRDELDEHYDRRERLIKASRDVTILSKKIIFLLHRIALEEDTDSTSSSLRAAKIGREKLREVQTMYAGMRAELVDDRFWRYERQVSPGLQEYIEALGFAHYLEHRTLVTFEQVQQSLSDGDGVPFFPLTTYDYLLGLLDLTGELMRFAITGISRRGGRNKAIEIRVFVRNCKADFERFTPYISDLRKKQRITTQSVEKIEDATYAMIVRGSEYELPPEILDDIVARSISHFNGSKRDNRRRDSDENDSHDWED